MTRAIRLSCLALLFVALGAASALAKPTIAVLGLEVVDKSGTPTPVDTQVAQELTSGLRARAKTGTGPYTIAPNSDKELIDEKLLKNCDDEKAPCMAAIGAELNADFLMYGSITKQGGAYQVNVNLLDVKRKQREKTNPQTIPIAEASGAALQGWARKIYSQLTGQTDTCSISIKSTGGVDQGTIKINNEFKGNIVAGSGEVKGLAEGKYSVTVEAKDFHPYQNSNVTCVAGQATTITPEMTKITEVGTGTGSGSAGNGSGEGSGSGSDGGVSGSYTHPKSHKGLWTAVAWGAVAGTAIAGGIWAYGYYQVSQYQGKEWEIVDTSGKTIFDQKSDGMGGTVNDYAHPKQFKDGNCGDPRGPDGVMDNRASVPEDSFATKGGTLASPGNSKLSSACSGNKIRNIALPVTIGLAVVAGAAFIMASRSPDKESSVQVSRTTAKNGHRVKREPFVIVPVVGPNGGGATFAMEW